MKLFLLVLSFFASSAFLSAQNSAQLSMTISNLEGMSGNIMIALYSSDIPFLGDQTTLSHLEKVTASKSQIVTINVPEGKYAIAIYQDLNKDRELNTNFFGIPKEPYGFSNDAMGMAGPPSFEEAMIEVKAQKQSINIKLR